MSRKEATYNTPIQTTVSYPIIGLTGLLNLVTVMDKFRPQAVAEKGCVCRPLSSPPPLGPSELIQLWMRLPAPNRQRLLWLLSQLLEHQLSAAAAQGETAMRLHHGIEEGQWYTEKMLPRHWERLAVVYVRQSTMQQVLE